MPHLDENALLGLMQGTTSPDAAAEIEEHLDRCEECRKLAAEIVKATVPASPAAAAPKRGGTLLERGTAVGRYVVLEALGAGSMGVVYAAYDPALDRKVSLKLLRSDLAHPDVDTARARLEREAQAMARLTHPNVAIVHDVGSFGDQLFVAMEYVEGGTLERWLAQPRAWREVLERFLAAGRGLEAAHAAGLVHRDFKPANVLVRHDGSVRVCDFGLAASGQVAGAKAELVGTPVYMAPEQLKGGAPDARSDQFSFCVALYEALYGARPFAGASVEALLESISLEPAAPAAGGAVPGWIRRVVVRGLSAAPEARYPDMTALLAALSRDPARTRARALAATLAAGTCAAALALWAAAGARHQAECSAGAAALAGVWDDAQRAKVAAVFKASTAPYSASMHAGAVRALDAYARSWAAMHDESCTATRVRGDQAEDIYHLRMACLVERRQRLGALTQLLAQADGPVVEKARAAVEALDPLSGCERAAVLAGRTAAPPPEKQQAVDAIRAELATHWAALTAGKYAQAREQASKALPAALATGYLPLEVQARALLAKAEAKAGNAAAAEEELFRLIAAGERAGDDRALARAWVELVYVQGYLRTQDQAGQRAAEIARAMLQRLGGDDELEAWLHNNLGAAHRSAGRLEQAQREFEQAIALHERVHGGDSAQLGVFVGNLGAALEMRGQYEEAKRVNQRALEVFTAQLGPDHPDTAGAVNNLGLIEEDLDQVSAALELYQRALQIRERALGPRHALIVTSLNNICVAQVGAGQTAEALDTCRRALALGDELLGADHPTIGSLLNSLAHALAAAGQPTEARAAYERALAVREKRLGPDHPNLGHDLVGLAELDLAKGDPKAAVPRAERAVKLREKGPDAVNLAKARFTLARALWESSADRDRARKLLTTARGALEQAGPAGRKGLAELEGWAAAHAAATVAVAPR